MNIPEKYINEIKERYKGKPLTRDMIVKDLALSYLLQEIGNESKKENSPFNKLIFKGGTLLAKSHLDYHRISEDLDFTYKYNFKLNSSKSKKEKQNKIRDFLKKEFLPALDLICDKYNFDFDSNEINIQGKKKYCLANRPSNVATFKIYLNKKELNPIKLEINFCDEPFYDLINSKIIHLNQESEHLPYPLNDFEIESYETKEILIEKIRAILTRKDNIHERDIYDLFLLFKIGHNVFDLDEELIFNKIKQGIGYLEDKEQEINFINDIEERLKILEDNLEVEISDMNLINYNKDEYLKFFQDLKKFIIGMDFKKLE